MPKRVPDQTITIRFEMQESEREMFAQLVNAYTLDQVTTPIVEILKDASALYAVVIMIEAFTDIDLPIPTPADADQIWAAIRDAIKNRKALYPAEPIAGSLAMIVKDFLVDLLGLGGGIRAKGGGGSF